MKKEERPASHVRTGWREGMQVQAEGIVITQEAGLARVKVQRSGGCGRCHEEGGCGNSAESRCDEFVVLDALDARPGDRVRIEIPEGVALRAALLAYGLPLAGVLIGAGLGYVLYGSDLAGVAGAVAGFIAGLAVLRGGRNKGGGRPRIAAIL